MKNMKTDTYGNEKIKRKTSVTDIMQIRVDYHKQYRHELVEFMSFEYGLRREQIMIMIVRSGFDADWFVSFPKYTMQEISVTAEWIYKVNGRRKIL